MAKKPRFEMALINIIPDKAMKPKPNQKRFQPEQKRVNNAVIP